MFFGIFSDICWYFVGILSRDSFFSPWYPLFLLTQTGPPPGSPFGFTGLDFLFIFLETPCSKPVEATIRHAYGVTNRGDVKGKHKQSNNDNNLTPHSPSTVGLYQYMCCPLGDVKWWLYSEGI